MRCGWMMGNHCVGGLYIYVVLVENCLYTLDMTVHTERAELYWKAFLLKFALPTI